MPDDRKTIPPAVLSRLTKYLAHIQALREDATEWVSSSEIAESLGLTSSTVRQDLSHVDFKGRSKLGYETAGLERTLINVLGADKGWNVAVVGAGNIGRALVLHDEFCARKFCIRAVFDHDPSVIGREIGSLVVRSMNDLADVVERENIDIGILAVPGGAAQSVADALGEAGVKGLLNLAHTHVLPPPGVSVIDSRLVANLMELAHKISVNT